MQPRFLLLQRITDEKAVSPARRFAYEIGEWSQAKLDILYLENCDEFYSRVRKDFAEGTTEFVVVDGEYQDDLKKLLRKKFDGVIVDGRDLDRTASCKSPIICIGDRAVKSRFYPKPGVQKKIQLAYLEGKRSPDWGRAKKWAEELSGSAVRLNGSRPKVPKADLIAISRTSDELEKTLKDSKVPVMLF